MVSVLFSYVPLSHLEVVLLSPTFDHFAGEELTLGAILTVSIMLLETACSRGHFFGRLCLLRFV